MQPFAKTAIFARTITATSLLGLAVATAQAADPAPDLAPNTAAGGDRTSSSTYQYDDGSGEELIGGGSGFGQGGAIVVANRFTAVGGADVIASISVAWGAVNNGRPAQIYIWQDPTSDANPADIVLVSTTNVAVQNAGSNTFNVYTLSLPVAVTGDFYVGVGIVHDFLEGPIRRDTTTPYVAGRSFFSISSNPIDPRTIALLPMNGYPLVRADSLSTSFSYQGRLTTIGTPYTGNGDITATIYDAETGGSPVGNTDAISGIEFTQGLFNVRIPTSASALSPGADRWLEIAVRTPAGSGAYNVLAPRQKITPAPTAISAITAGFANNATTAASVPWSGVTGAPWSTVAGGITYGDGAVGIGTTSPSARLEVNAAAGDGLFVHTPNESPWALRIGNDTATAAGFQTGMYVTNSGFFRITNRVANPAGTYAQLGTNGVWTAPSDARLKTDISSAEGLLDTALKLNPVNYRWKSDGTQGLGLIAQDARKVLPTLVTGDESTDTLTLDYNQLSVVAVGAIREQQRQIESLKAGLANRDAENTELKQRLAAIEAALTELRSRK